MAAHQVNITDRAKRATRHRCHYCGMLSACRRVMDSGGNSTELVWVCRAAKFCKKRMEGAGVIFQTFAKNPGGASINERGV
jgi:hypothetical protein